MNNTNMITVLIADDEESIRQGLKNAINWDELGLEIAAITSDGFQTVDYIAQYKPDIVITDICMPGLNGLEVIKQSNELSPKTQFIILSGYNDFTYAQQAINYGARSYLLKPLNLQQLTGELLKLCSEITTKNSIKLNLQNMRDSSRLHLLNHLIHGQYNQIIGLSKQLEDLKVKITDGPSRLIVCSIQNPDNLPHFEENAISQLKQHLTNIPCEIWSPNQYQIAVLFNTYSLGDELVLNLARRCLHVLSIFDNCIIGIGVGDFIESLNRTDYCYNRALLALSYQLYKDKPSIHIASSICNQAPALSPSSIDYTFISNAILENDQKKMIEECEKFFHSLFYVPEPPPTFTRSMCIYLVINVLNELNKKSQPNFSFPEIMYKELNQLMAFSEIRNWILEFFKDCCQRAVLIRYPSFKNEHDSIIESIKCYIQENINSNIKTKNIASFVNLSESYCTFYFKSKVGCNLRDYILNQKMDYAKKLIDEKRMLINEIAFELGYTDYRSFSRAFKNITGLSPSEYSHH